MSEEKNTNMFGEEISPEEMKIIDFINERELFYESEARVKISDEVKEKFGDSGVGVLRQLSEDVHIDPKDFECDECGEASKELLSVANEKIKLMELLVDDELTKVVDYVLNKGIRNPIANRMILEGIEKYTQYKKDIPLDVIQKVKIKILFTGILEGWLINENFE